MQINDVGPPKARDQFLISCISPKLTGLLPFLCSEGVHYFLRKRPAGILRVDPKATSERSPPSEAAAGEVHRAVIGGSFLVRQK
jgi:hypothetical protein